MYTRANVATLGRGIFFLLSTRLLAQAITTNQLNLFNFVIGGERRAVPSGSFACWISIYELTFCDKSLLLRMLMLLFQLADVEI